MEEVLKKIYDYSLEEIMGDRFSRYSKAIIQDRALPDVRDGLKPVQRRILYAMYRDKNTFDHPYKKSAKTVGNVMGQYHPHGDSSIYEAMVRMSQWWKQNTIFIDMHGNNGSMDGDGPAAMRYTEARLSKISNELLKDIDKNTIPWAWNYDDTLEEPVVLPAKFPNLLVNGANGISAGYATNIPPHNLGEIVDATIKRIESPNCRLETILDIVKGPDFPTGGIVEGKQGIIDAFTQGRGKVNIKSKYRFEKTKGKEQIIIDEIPFEVNKAQLVKKIDEIRIDKKIEGIAEIRDESDREGLRIAIDLKKDANKELIINYLLKNTDLQISYSYNMVAIVNRRPMTLGIISILDAYIEHQKEVITKRTKFNLDNAIARMNIVEGLIKVLSILDEVIKTIRNSQNKQDAKLNLMKEYGFNEAQAEAIVILQLYKLTNTDVTELLNEKEDLKKIIEFLQNILSSEEKLKKVMTEELKLIKKEYATDRKTIVKDEVTEIKIDLKETIAKEDVIVVVSHEGYIKRVSKKSYNNQEETGLKEGDYLIFKHNMNTIDSLLLFTDLGNYLYVPVYEIPDLKWKDLGKHISNIIKISANENIIYALPYNDENKNITIASKDGMIKRTNLKEFKVSRYSKPINCMKLKENDKIVSIDSKDLEDILIVTQNGYALRYQTDEIPVVGIKAGGVKAVTLKNDSVIKAQTFNDTLPYVTIITTKQTAKRVKLTELEKTARARKGTLIIRDVKTNPYKIKDIFIAPSKLSLGILNNEGINYIKITDIPILDKNSTGTSISKHTIYAVFKEIQEEQDQIEEITNEEILEKAQEKMLTIDDFLKQFKID
ncbi:MAG: DNA topoisomerase IV subunit A [Bacilli bacterium]|nr:DNA topoisomerase IV subunit A [Bacilli bacterium]